MFKVKTGIKQRIFQVCNNRSDQIITRHKFNFHDMANTVSNKHTLITT